MEAWMLTPEEIAIAVDRAYNVEPSLGAFNAIAAAQADKMIREGFKSPEEWQDLRDQWIKIAKQEARQEALREAHGWLRKHRHINGASFDWFEFEALMNALKSGRMPGGDRERDIQPHSQ